MSFYMLDQQLLGSATSAVVKADDYHRLVDARKVLNAVHESVQQHHLHLDAARRQAVQEGYAAGIDMGKDAWARQLAERHIAGQARLRNLHHALVEVVMSSLRHLVLELPTPHQFELLAQQVLKSVVRAKQMRLVVATADALAARAVLERWQQEHPDVLNIDVMVDDALVANDCILETEEGAIDGRLQHRLNLIEASLRSHLSSIPIGDDTVNGAVQP